MYSDLKKILLLLDLQGNFIHKHYKIYHFNLNAYLHYLVKRKNYSC